jgi:hypothetical protein
MLGMTGDGLNVRRYIYSCPEKGPLESIVQVVSRQFCSYNSLPERMTTSRYKCFSNVIQTYLTRERWKKAFNITIVRMT